MFTWDYNLPENWKPQTQEEWAWYLVRKINQSDLTGFTKDDLAKYFPAVKKNLDPGKRALLEYYLTGSY